MPELPEVEVIRQGLQIHLPGHRIEAIFHSGKNLRHPVPLQAMQQILPGSKFSRVSRRAKFLLLSLDNGAVLIVHLGMTGRLGIFPAGTPVAAHDHVRLLLDHGLELRLYDPRRFGSVHILAADEVRDIEKTFFKTAGPEPLGDDCSPEYLYTKAQQKKQPVKTFLMDMKVIVGIGNIYANESLFSSGINPLRPSMNLSRQDWRRLLQEIRRILKHAIDCGGSTISDYLNASGERGLFQVHFNVYGKMGEPCPQCGSLIEKVQIGGRASYFCPQCQKK